MSAPLGAGFEGAGLRTEQAPPLAIPASFLLVAPFAMVASGALLAGVGPEAMTTRAHPLAFAATHLGTIGFLGAIMLGALYQMIPVVAGAPVPFARLAHAVQALLVAGTIALVHGFETGDPRAFAAAPALLGAALVLFLGPVAVALARAPTRGATVAGMRVAVAGLAALGVLGVLLASARAGLLALAVDWTAATLGHATLGALVWVGGLLTAVSWQLVPMFWLTEPIPRWSQVASLAATGLALVGAPVAVALGAGATVVAAIAAPAAVAVWLVQPIVLARALARRRRRRADPVLLFLRAGLAGGVASLALAVAAFASDALRLAPALGLVAIWGWAGLVAHGMLCRIVPFLVWFHRFSRLAGLTPVPSMRSLLPDRRVRVAFGLHAGAVAAGAAGVLAAWGPLVRLGGALLAAAGVALAVNLASTLRRRPDAAPGGAHA